MPSESNITHLKNHQELLLVKGEHYLLRSPSPVSLARTLPGAS